LGRSLPFGCQIAADGAGGAFAVVNRQEKIKGQVEEKIKGQVE
jgi:hypothetical protein